MQSGHALDGADAHSFQQAPEREHRVFLVDAQVLERLRRGVSERLPAVVAAESLIAVPIPGDAQVPGHVLLRHGLQEFGNVLLEAAGVPPFRVCERDLYPAAGSAPLALHLGTCISIHTALDPIGTVRHNRQNRSAT